MNFGPLSAPSRSKVASLRILTFEMRALQNWVLKIIWWCWNLHHYLILFAGTPSNNNNDAQCVCVCVYICVCVHRRQTKLRIISEKWKFTYPHSFSQTEHFSCKVKSFWNTLMCITSQKWIIKFECLHRLIFCNKTFKKVHVPPEVYVPPQEVRLHYCIMYVEEFNLFLHYKWEKHFRILMEMTVQMYSSNLIA